MRVERIPTLGDNYTYLIIDEATNEAAAVDAPEAGPVVARVDALGVNLTKVLSTHHHWDHSAANPELAQRYQAPVFGHASDAERIMRSGFRETRLNSAGALATSSSTIARSKRTCMAPSSIAQPAAARCPRAFG